MGSEAFSSAFFPCLPCRLLSRLYHFSSLGSVKMGMGSLFSVCSVLALWDRMDPLSLPMFDNTL